MKALAAIMGTAAMVMLMGAGAGAQNLVMTPSKLLPAAVIHLNLGSDQNGNTTVDLTAQHLAQPSNLHPPKSVYVVWVQRDDQRPQRKGQLTVDNNLNGELKFVTPEQQFVVIITAEDTANPSTPSGLEVTRSLVARKK